MSRNHVIVHQIRDAGMSVTDASRYYKISRQRIYLLLRAYDDGGDSALEPASKNRIPTRVPPAPNSQHASSNYAARSPPTASTQAP